MSVETAIYLILGLQIGQALNPLIRLAAHVYADHRKIVPVDVARPGTLRPLNHLEKATATYDAKTRTYR